MNHAAAETTPTSTTPIPAGGHTRSFLPGEDDEFPHLPHKVILTEKDDEMRLLDELQELYTAHFDKWAEREQERILSRETRFGEEDPSPQFPLIIKTSRTRSHPLFIVLPNGQRVLRLDSGRIQTLCGIQQILPLNQALMTFGRRMGRARCGHCEGFHRTIRVTTPAPAAPHADSLPLGCPKCGADALACYVREDRDTLKCCLCSYRLYRPTPTISDHDLRPMPTLTEADVQANDAQLLRHGVFDEKAEDCVESDELEDDMFDLSDTAEEPDDQTSESLDAYLTHEDHGHHQDDPAEPDADEQDLQDRLHEPAYALFTKGRTPLRQAMLDQAFRALDNPAHRMALWTAAGRILRESGKCIAPMDAAAIAEWLRSLPDEDLTLMAGDPESPNPQLIAPALALFWNTDRLLTPLLRYFGEQLRRFRNKEAGCRILAEDYGLSEEGLRHIAVVYGYMPAPAQSDSAASDPPRAA